MGSRRDVGRLCPELPPVTSEANRGVESANMQQALVRNVRHLIYFSLCFNTFSVSQFNILAPTAAVTVNCQIIKVLEEDFVSRSASEFGLKIGQYPRTSSKYIIMMMKCITSRPQS